MNKGKLVIWFLLITFSALGQSEKSYIEVMGSAESEITPNIIVIAVRLKEFEENKEKVTLDKIESEFMSAVLKSKVNKENIQLTDLTVNAIQQRKRDRDFYSQKTYEVGFSKTDEVLVFLENLKNVKVDYLRIAKLSHSDIEKYRLEIKIAALKAAERKADALLNSVGVKRGKPLLINENPSEGPNWYPANMQSNALYEVADVESLEISDVPLRKIKLRFEILARFEIE